MLAYKINSREIVNQIFIPKYYDPELKRDLSFLEESHSLLSLGDLLDAGDITVQTGHEIGKMAYGTGNIPFVRTSDITNWEIKLNRNQLHYYLNGYTDGISISYTQVPYC